MNFSQTYLAQKWKWAESQPEANHTVSTICLLPSSILLAPLLRTGYVIWGPRLTVRNENVGARLSPLRLLSQNTPDRVADKQENVISPSSEGCKFKVKVPAWLGKGRLLDRRLLVASSHGGRG